MQHPLVSLYIPLICWVGVGYLASKRLPQSVAGRLGQFLFWVGVPFSILVFIRNANLDEPVWLAAGVAAVAVILCGMLARIVSRERNWSRATRGSFYLSSMFGNTGYLGYPVILTLLGSKVFAWALFYDLAGTTLGAYGIGVAIAGLHGQVQLDIRRLLATILKNPALWSVPMGLLLRNTALPEWGETLSLQLAWGVVNLSLVLIGMRVGALNAQPRLTPIALGLGIKMLTVPLLLSLALPWLGITGDALRALVLQMGMPPAFATLVLSETFELDHDLTVSMLVSGSLGLLALLPLWLWILA